MKRCFSILLALVMLAVALPAWVPVARSQSSPVILSAKLTGKKLTITGLNFAQGAVILINGQKQSTRNSATNPGEVLIAKKGGKRIARSQVVTIQVMNSPDLLSNEFMFFGGPIITLADNGKTIALSVGEQFLLAIGGNFNWSIAFLDQSTIVRVPTLIAIPGSQGIFEVVASGKATIAATGVPNCGKCPDPPVQFAVTLIID